MLVSGRGSISVIGEEFNLNSPVSYPSSFEKLGLPVIKRTKTGYSTDAEVLVELVLDPIVELILEHRQLMKLKAPILTASYPSNASTGKIHTTFNQTVTTTKA